MELSVEGTEWTGEVIDLRDRGVDRDAVVAAIRGDPSPYDAHCPDPGLLHGRVGVVTPDVSVQPKTALAVAARSQGLSAPQDDRVEALRAERDAVEIPAVPATPDAPPADDVTRLRERVAALRGEVQTLESTGHDPTEARDRLRDVAGRLAEVETERAARQQASERLRAVRDARERRLRIEDRLANAEREARSHLVEQLRQQFTDAVGSLVETDDPVDAPPDVLALAILRVGDVDAYAIVCVDRFDSPRASAEWLDAPVIRL